MAEGEREISSMYSLFFVNLQYLDLDEHAFFERDMQLAVVERLEEGGLESVTEMRRMRVYLQGCCCRVLN